MDSVISESGNIGIPDKNGVYPDGNGFDEVFTPLNESEILQFIKNESSILKRTADTLELNLSHMQLLENLNTIYIKDEKQQIGVGIYLEDNIIAGINDYMSNLTKGM